MIISHLAALICQVVRVSRRGPVFSAFPERFLLMRGTARPASLTGKWHVDRLTDSLDWKNIYLERFGLATTCPGQMHWSFIDHADTVDLLLTRIPSGH
jgi:hypothetical protein